MLIHSVSHPLDLIIFWLVSHCTNHAFNGLSGHQIFHLTITSLFGLMSNRILISRERTATILQLESLIRVIPQPFTRLLVYMIHLTLLAQFPLVRASSTKIQWQLEVHVESRVFRITTRGYGWKILQRFSICFIPSDSTYSNPNRIYIKIL